MIYSPLRYPGGKNKVAKFMQQIIAINGLEGGVYVEPYAGGAGVALNLLLEGKVSKVIINDIDRSIYAFWYCVKHKPEELIKKIQSTQVTLNVWRRQKKVQDNKEKADIFQLGFSTFFLNRTNRSGIISGGPIGGFDQKSEWKIDARYTKKELIKRIRDIAKQRKKIEVYNEDARDLIKILSKRLNAQTLIYLDPPYYVKGEELYANHYQHKDHLLISDSVHGRKRPHWVVSYDAVKEIIGMYPGKKRFFDLRYTAAEKQSIGKEVMFFSPKTKVPRGPIIQPSR